MRSPCFPVSHASPLFLRAWILIPSSPVQEPSSLAKSTRNVEGYSPGHLFVYNGKPSCNEQRITKQKYNKQNE